LPRELKPAFSALWNLDLALADVVATSSDPRLGAVRLAWWRERLEALDAGAAAPAEPRLIAVAAELLPLGITGNELSRLEDAWLPLLEPFPWGSPQAEGLILRGRLLFGIGARMLGEAASDAAEAGALWSLVDGEHHCSDPQSREVLRKRASVMLAAIRAPVPRSLRVLTVLGALAAADLVREGSGLKRLSAAVRHRLMGSLPHS
jgi:phytoene synthase